MSISSHTHLPYAYLLGEVCSDLPPSFKLGLLSSCCSLGIPCGCKPLFNSIIYPWLCGAALVWSPGCRVQGSVAAAPRLWSPGSVAEGTGLAAPRHVGSQTSGRTQVPCVGRWALYPWAAREALACKFHQTTLLSEHLLPVWLVFS